MSYWRVVLPTLAAAIYVADAKAQVGVPIHSLPTTTTTPVPTGSCFIVDQFNGGTSYQTTRLCNNWATAIGAITGTAGMGNPITVQDTLGNVASGLATLAFGPGFSAASGLSSGLVNVNIFAPDRTVSSGYSTFVSGDLGGLVNLTGTVTGFSVPATGTGVWSQGGMAILNNINIPSVAVNNVGQVNGCRTTLYSGGFSIYTNNGVSLDCFGFPGFGAASGLVGGWLLGTITATGNSAIQFYGANWSSSYGTLRLRCRGIYLSANVNLLFQVGEGGGGGLPTWQTSNNYFSAGWFVNVSGAFTPWRTSTAPDLLDNSVGLSTSPTSWELEIDNVSSAYPKNVMFKAAAGIPGASQGPESGMGYWAGDNNVITGLQVIPSTGTIVSGTCSLFGVP